MIFRSVCRLIGCLTIFLLFLSSAYGADVRLKWNGSSGDPTGYRLYYGTSQGSHPNKVEVGNALEYIVQGLDEDVTYYFVARAYNDVGESGNSNEVSWNSSVTVDPDTDPPTLSISGPFSTVVSSVDLSGTANDNQSIAEVVWENDQGGSGTADGTANWEIKGIPLVEGANTITVSASDPSGNIGKASITVTYNASDGSGPPVPVPPSIYIYFPHVASNGTYETEIALINSSATQAINGDLIAYNDSGVEVARMSISLNANGRREIIVGEEFSSASQIGYLVFQSDSNMCEGYTKFYIDGVYRVAVPAVSKVNTGDIYISHIASTANWWTGISILNTTSSSKELTIEFDNGETKTKTLAANEHIAFTIRSLFDDQAQTDIPSAVIKNGSGVVGLELFGSTEGSGNYYLSGILLKDDLTTQMYYPHIASDSMWWTGVAAYNPSTSPCDIRITPYSAEGTALPPQDLTIDGMGKYIGTVADLNLPFDTAWFQVEATSPISGFELFGTRDGNQLGGYTGVGISDKEGTFAKIESDGWTDIAFVNIEGTSTTVTLTAHDDNGNTVATETISLSPYEKVVNLAEGIFTQNISSATYIRYTSDKEVVGFQLNSSSDDMMLDGLPGM